MARYRFLDSLRGFALLGIILVNILSMVEAAPQPGRTVLDYTVQARFVPIFSLLFGISLYLIADGARRRSVAPWKPLVLRMIGLGAAGVLHALVFSGDILREYAIGGALVIPLVVWAPAWVNLIIGTFLTGLSFSDVGAVIGPLPSLLLLGAAAAGLGLPARIEASPMPGVAMAVVGGVAAVPLMSAYLHAGGGDPRFAKGGISAGLAMALLYIGLLALLWRLPSVRRVLRACFEPLGRMSLTNYVTASVVVAVLLRAGVLGPQTSMPALMLVAIGIIAAQSAISRIWLSRLRYGPLEWLLRAVTWRTVPPLRRRRPDERALDTVGAG